MNTHISDVISSVEKIFQSKAQGLLGTIGKAKIIVNELDVYLSDTDIRIATFRYCPGEIDTAIFLFNSQKTLHVFCSGSCLVEICRSHGLLGLTIRIEFNFPETKITIKQV